MSVMTEKRNLLATELETILQAFDSDYRIEQRWRKATFIAQSRSERVDIMGKRTTYCEVLYQPMAANIRASDATSRDKRHQFLVRVWYGFYEAKTLSKSSQNTWDDITEGTSGVLKSLEGKEGLTDNGTFKYTLFQPTQITERMVTLDGDGQEFAHFMQFQIELGI